MTKLIGYKSFYGTYKNVSKVFKSEDHFSNWYDYMSNKGNKIVTIIDVK